MTVAIEVTGLTRRFGSLRAVDDVSFTVEEGIICGLLGRNGAGKTTLMQLLTGQDFATSGGIRVFGQSPVENAEVLQDICFIKESQKYPDDFRVKHVMKSAPWFFKNWDAEFASKLVEEFQLPLGRKIKKLSRGQLSSVGVIVGLASRSPLTFFDEPYLGLDAVARHLFYDRLLEDYALYPRTVILSTHLIDEVSNLLEHVLVIDEGRIIIDKTADDLRGSATTVVGAEAAVLNFAQNREVFHREHIGGISSITVGALSSSDKHAAIAAGLELSPVSLQQLIIQKTTPQDSPTTSPKTSPKTSTDKTEMEFNA